MDMRERQSGYRRGMTLTELLVVLAIVAIGAGITIPTLIRAGAFEKTDVMRSSRVVYDGLRGAQSRAAKNRKDTAVVYLPELVTDSFSGDPVMVATGAALFEWRDGAYRPVPDDGALFVMLEDRVQLRNPYAGLPEDIFDEAATDTEAGFAWIDLYTDDGDPIPPPVATGLTQWPAHVFTPSGYMRTDTPRERLSVVVGPAHDAPLSERFIDPDNPVDPEPVMGSRIDVSKSTGRVRLRAEDEGW